MLKVIQNDCVVCARIVNGTESTYAYDRQRERLQGMLLTANGDSIMQTQYKYDPVDNILDISNVITPKAPKKPKGSEGRAVWIALTLYPAPILSVTRQCFTKLLHRRQAHSLQNRCGHIPKRLRPWRKRRHGRAERLPDAYDADRKTTRGLLPQAGHAAGSAPDEGCDGRTREHTRGHLLLPHRPPRYHILHHRCQGQRRPVRCLSAMRRTAC